MVKKFVVDDYGLGMEHSRLVEVHFIPALRQSLMVEPDASLSIMESGWRGISTRTSIFDRAV